MVCFQHYTQHGRTIPRYKPATHLSSVIVCGFTLGRINPTARKYHINLASPAEIQEYLQQDRLIIEALSLVNRVLQHITRVFYCWGNTSSWREVLQFFEGRLQIAGFELLHEDGLEVSCSNEHLVHEKNKTFVNFWKKAE